MVRASGRAPRDARQLDPRLTARATDLSGFLPTFIDPEFAEVVRDEEVEYASKIWAIVVESRRTLDSARVQFHP